MKVKNCKKYASYILENRKIRKNLKQHLQSEQQSLLNGNINDDINALKSESAQKILELILKNPRITQDGKPRYWI